MTQLRLKTIQQQQQQQQQHILLSLAVSGQHVHCSIRRISFFF